MSSPRRLVLSSLALLAALPAASAPPGRPDRPALTTTGLSPSASVFVLGTANNPGLFDSYFTTDVFLVNPNGDGKVAVVVQAISTVGAVDGQFTVELPPGGFEVVKNVLGRMGVRGAHVLAIFVDAAASTADTPSFNAWGYTSTPSKCGPGDYGVTVPVVTLTSLDAETDGACVGAEISTGKRTNVGVVNNSAAPLSVTVRAVDPAKGAVGELPFDVPPWGFTQISLSNFVSGTLENGALLFRNGTGRYVGYMVVNDNLSNDALFQVALPDR